MKMKYIILKENGLEVPYIFPEVSAHNRIASKLTRDDLSKVYSAGFCTVSYDNNCEQHWSCFGKSTLLNIPSLPNDNLILDRMFSMNS